MNVREPSRTIDNDRCTNWLASISLNMLGHERKYQLCYTNGYTTLRGSYGPERFSHQAGGQHQKSTIGSAWYKTSSKDMC